MVHGNPTPLAMEIQEKNLMVVIRAPDQLVNHGTEMEEVLEVLSVEVFHQATIMVETLGNLRNKAIQIFIKEKAITNRRVENMLEVTRERTGILPIMKKHFQEDNKEEKDAILGICRLVKLLVTFLENLRRYVWLVAIKDVKHFF